MNTRLLISLLISLFTCSMNAQEALPVQCIAGRPKAINQNLLKEADLDKFIQAGDWGQNEKIDAYWNVYSDRSHNTTYNSASFNSGECGELEFNQEVRIAQIKNGFAQVYKEKRSGSKYPLISTDTENYGWIPMDHLLLWQSCPTNLAGIYNKALIVLNLDGQDDDRLGSSYANPDTRDGAEEIVADMRFYFVMKKDNNGMVLLSTKAKMDGVTSRVLYGWVSTNSYVPWDQRTCLEPNWTPQVAENLRGTAVDIVRQDGTKATEVKLGRTNGLDNPSTKYRFEPSLLRYPLLGSSQQQYQMTAFARPNGESNVPTVPTGKRGGSRDEIMEQTAKEANTINLIIVIDGTRSMEPFYNPIQQAVKSAYETFGDKRDVKVGVVIYRDYADGEYLTEKLTMRKPTDPSVASFLASGGEYGIKSSPNDRTNAEALYQGLAVALDAKAMGYTPHNSNLMFVVGDCGNDPTDNKCLTQEQIIDKCAHNNMQLVAFQVRNENEQAFLLFRQQMVRIVRGNIQKQNTQLVERTDYRFKELADGYEYESLRAENESFYYGAVRNAALGKEMEVVKLNSLIKDCYTNIDRVIDAGIGTISNADRVIRETSDAARSSRNNVNLEFLRQRFTEEQIRVLQENNTLMAFRGFSEIRNPNGQDYWKPVLYISQYEFNEMMLQFSTVYRDGLKGDRRSYVNAMKELLRRILPDITNEDMGKMGVQEIMSLVSGLNVPTDALAEHSLQEIQDKDLVSDDEFDNMLSRFKEKYEYLDNIKGSEYPFSYLRDETRWYWLPVDLLP